MSALMQADRLGVTVGGRRVLDGLSLTLPAGRWVALVGRNGAGKSTLLATLAGLRRPDAGEVLLRDRPLTHWPARERARHLAWLGQAGAAEGELPAVDVVRLGRLPHQGLLGSPGAADETAVLEAMRITDCTTLARRPLSELSGGERQRVLLARALATGSEVLLLDEPLAHLDPPHQRALVQAVRARCAAGGAAVTVLHDLTLALMADQVMLLDQGRIAAQGEPSDPALRAALESAFAGAFSIEGIERDGWVRWVVVPRA